MLQAVSSQKELLVAIVGCSHGELEIIFNEVKKQNETGDKIDILLCCGDFQVDYFTTLS
jgi:predicted phosphodiesterase